MGLNFSTIIKATRAFHRNLSYFIYDGMMIGRRAEGFIIIIIILGGGGGTHTHIMALINFIIIKLYSIIATRTHVKYP